MDSISKRQRVRERHGMSKSSTYTSWQAMLRRCQDPGFESFPKYGGRGITVDPRWLLFTTFLDDMGERPPGMTLDRRDGTRGYNRENCRWATRVQQNVNRRGKLSVTGYRGVKKHHRRWRADIGHQDAWFFIGSFDTPEEAAWMYDQFALAFWGADAQLNFEYVQTLEQ